MTQRPTVAMSMHILADRAFVKLLTAGVSETACLNRNASWHTPVVAIAIQSADNATGNEGEQGSNTAVAAVVVKRLCGARLSNPTQIDNPRLCEETYTGFRCAT